MNFTKSLLAFVLAGFMFVGCKDATKETPKTSETVAATTTKTAVTGKVETTSFTISGMTCAVMCAAKIEKELSAMDGVQKATVDFDKKTATVEYDNAKQTPEKFVEKVESVADGKTYKVSNLKSSADKAMLIKGDQEKEKAKKEKKSKKEDKKSCSEDEKSKEGKGGCCSGKKHCSKDEKSGSM